MPALQSAAAFFNGFFYILLKFLIRDFCKNYIDLKNKKGFVRF